MPKTVAILGRPNVGKSTLFNRLAGRRLALVHDTPGVTRDWKITPVKIGSLSFDLVDTAGLDEDGDKSLTTRMKRSTQSVLEEKADIGLFVIDARVGLTPIDEEIASWVRPFKKPIIVVANKAEGKAGEAGYYEAFRLGFGDPIAFSAEHGEGYGELITRLAELIPPEEDQDMAEPEVGGPLKLAIIGRPNAGKSTLINNLLGDDRLLTGPEAGITRDAIAVDWIWKGTAVKLFDTAGVRKRARVKGSLEKLSVGDTLNAINFAESVVLMLEPELPVAHQDIRLASKVLDEGRSLLIAFNKVDQIENLAAFKKNAIAYIEEQLPHAKGITVLFISALEGTGLDKLMPAVLKAHRIWNTRVPTAKLNRWLEGVLTQHPLPLVKRRVLKIKYAAQIKSRPPTFALYANRPKEIPDTYVRYMENELRRVFQLPGIPIRLYLRGGKNPYIEKKKS